MLSRCSNIDMYVYQVLKLAEWVWCSFRPGREITEIAKVAEATKLLSRCDKNANGSIERDIFLRFYEKVCQENIRCVEYLLIEHHMVTYVFYASDRALHLLSMLIHTSPEIRHMLRTRQQRSHGSPPSHQRPPEASHRKQVLFLTIDHFAFHCVHGSGPGPMDLWTLMDPVRPVDPMPCRGPRIPCLALATNTVLQRMPCSMTLSVLAGGDYQQ